MPSGKPDPSKQRRHYWANLGRHSVSDSEDKEIPARLGAIETRQEKIKPQLSDLRNSGSIEMDSDIVLFTHIERYENQKPTGNACHTIAKQRDGVQVEIPL